ncbi:MAG: protein translocase subunit SecF [Candidatus Pacebacteria bacterium]|jgi:preprotein translocase subunit SecF|nr:protein translocase subunit SecF [Candidatus Paceibacterota bacterium]
MNFIQKSKIFYSFSGIIITISLLSLLIWGFNFGIDFTGGSLWELSVAENINQSTEKINNYLKESDLGQVDIQTTSENSLILRFSNISEEKHIKLLGELKEIIPSIEERRFESIGPSIGQELKTKSIWAIILVFFGILTYLWYAFRHSSLRVPSYRYGILAVLVLMHDAIFIIGLFVILGKFQGWEVNSDFLVALLVVIGYSVHDTIVVFDRIRENFKLKIKDSLENIINLSIQQTLVRSLNTSLTTIFPLLTLYFFGPLSIKILVVAMISGVIIGTYSSVFLAAPLLYEWSIKKA